MKKLMPFLLIVLLSNYQLSGQNKFNSPAYPGIIEIINPDSSRLNIRLFGDEFFHYVLTIDGYTIKQNKLGYYEYSTLSADSSTLACSGIRAHDPKDRTDFEMKYLDGNRKNIQEYLKYSSNPSFTNLTKNITSFRSIPLTGTIENLVILIDFTDRGFIHQQPAFEVLMNEENYNNTGSFRDYYLDNSFDQLVINSTVVGWYHANGNLATYGANDEYGTDVNPRLLVQEAIDAAEDE